LPLVFVRRPEPDNRLIMVFFCSWKSSGAAVAAVPH
jgi:hypothetical protein